MQRLSRGFRSNLSVQKCRRATSEARDARGRGVLPRGDAPMGVCQPSAAPEPHLKRHRDTSHLAPLRVTGAVPHAVGRGSGASRVSKLLLSGQREESSRGDRRSTEPARQHLTAIASLACGVATPRNALLRGPGLARAKRHLTATQQRG